MSRVALLVVVGVLIGCGLFGLFLLLVEGAR